MARVLVIDRNQTRRLAAYLLGPVAASIYALAFWRFAADMNWFGGDFIINNGLFSRWQVWLALAAATQTAAHHLARGRSR